MVYIASWAAYQEAVEALYLRSPVDTRYVIKWNASKKQLVLKVTDNASCIKFKTYSSVYLGRFEALNAGLLERMRNKRQVKVEEVEEAKEEGVKEEGKVKEEVGKTPMPVAVPGGGVGKKKRKGKKSKAG